MISDSDVEAERGLGGRLETRVLTLLFGGSGNAPMLVVLRIVLPGAEIPEAGEAEDRLGEGLDVEVARDVFTVGTEGVERALEVVRVGRPDEVTTRAGAFKPDVGIAEVVAAVLGLLSEGASGPSGCDFLVFATGRAGRGPDGGASGDVEGRRGVAEEAIEVMVAVADADMTG